MAKRIQVLSERITQKIAAGEVVERPASVVKELMENAIDARGSEIVVELKAGGLQIIRVIDNGEGIDPEDIPLALQRFATSKIRQVEDLYDIHTLGFRGEALPSIASVSRMIIKSRVAQTLSGTRIICEGGVVKETSEIGCPVGTEVEVRDLFYNFPVKRKFVKSIRSELRQIVSQFLRLSLGHPSISFRLIHDDRVIQELVSSESQAVRIEAVLGREIYEQLRPIAFEEEEVQVSGFASLPSFSRGTTGIYLTNDRSVRDRMVLKATVPKSCDPFGEVPPPSCLNYLPPSAVDGMSIRQRPKFKTLNRFSRCPYRPRAFTTGLRCGIFIKEFIPSSEREFPFLPMSLHRRGAFEIRHGRDVQRAQELLRMDGGPRGSCTFGTGL
jgi:DNA mismatch repair protein MutL